MTALAMEYKAPNGATFDLDTDEGLYALDCEIAQRLGWRVDYRGGVKCLIDPEGENVYCFNDRQWPSDRMEDIDYYYTRIPHYTRDAEAAMRLRVPEIDEDGLTTTTHEWVYQGCRRFRVRFGNQETPAAASHAIARCLAWLLFDDARPAKVGRIVNFYE